jgi:hypothetical protein
MGKIVEWGKDHPKLAIALVAGIIVLIYLYSRRASAAAASTTTASGLSEAGYIQLQTSQLAAATQVQGQTIAAGVATQQSTDALQAQQISAATQLGIAQLQAGVANNTLYAQSGVSSQNITAQEQVALATIQANQQTAADQLALEQALINVIGGRQNVLNPAPTTPVSPVIVSSGPSSPGPPWPMAQVTQPSPLPADSRATTAAGQQPSGGPTTPIPAATPTGYGEIPGVNYSLPNAPYAPTYTFGNVQQAEAAGMATFNPQTGMYVYAPNVTV